MKTRAVVATVGGLLFVLGTVGIPLYVRCNRAAESNGPSPSSSASRPHPAPPASSSLEPFRQGDLFGYKLQNGEVVIKPQFLRAEPFSHGRAVVWVGTDHGVRAGYIDTRGRFVIPPRYTYADPFDRSKVAEVRVSELWGYVNRQGAWVIEPQFEHARPFKEGLAAIAWYRYPPPATDPPSYAWTHLKPDGTLLVPEILSAIWTGDFSHGLAPFRCTDDRYGSIDRAGNMDRKCTWEGLCPFDGKALLSFAWRSYTADPPHCVAVGHEAAVFDARGPLPFGYSRIVLADLDEPEFAFARLSPGRPWQMVSESFDSYQGYPEPFDGSSETFLIVESEKLGFAVYDARGQKIVPFQRERIAAYNDDVVIYEAGGPGFDRSAANRLVDQIGTLSYCARRYGARHRSGRALLPPRFAFLDAFSEGLAAACEASPTLADKSEGPCVLRLEWCGYVNLRGERRIDLPRAIFTPKNPGGADDANFASQQTSRFLRDADEHRARATLDGGPMGLFREGAASMVGLTSKGDKTVGLIDRKGQWLVPPRFHTILPFSRLPDGRWLAPAQDPGEEQWLDIDGKPTKSPL